MNILGKTLRSIILCLALVVTGQAYAGSISFEGIDWAVDPDGLGTDESLIEVSKFDYLSFTYATFDEGSITDFTDYSVFFATGAENEALKGIYATSTMTGSLDGTSPEFDSGSTMVWYDIADNPILTLELVSGTGTAFVNQSYNEETGDIDIGTIVGFLVFQYEVISAESGYFYVWDGSEYVDLALVLENGYYMESISTFQNYDGDEYDKAQAGLDEIGSNLDIADELQELADITEEELITAVNTPTTDGFISFNDGNIDMGIVPEPGMLSLMGLAFFGLAGFQRRRKSQQS